MEHCNESSEGAARLPRAVRRAGGRNIVPGIALSIALAIGPVHAAGNGTVVDLGAIAQQQTGTMNVQAASVGNVSGNASSQVTGTAVIQSQSGTQNAQQVSIGNAAGNGSAKVQFGRIVQTQDGSANSESVEIGNAINGSTNVTVGDIIQDQTGSHGNKQVRIGNN
jgi:hypothetical protein